LRSDQEEGIALLTAFVYEPALRQQANRQGRNYWYEYIREINNQLGLCAQEILPSALSDPGALAGVGFFLMVGDLTAEQMGDDAPTVLEN